MFLFKGKAYDHIDFNKTITKAISNESRMLFCDTKNQIHFDVTRKHWLSPRGMYALPEQRQEIFAKVKKQKELLVTTSMKSPDGGCIDTEINVVLRNNIFISWVRIPQKNNPTNIRIDYSSHLNVLFVNCKFPVAPDDHIKAIIEINKLAHQHNIKVLIFSIQNPEKLDFIQLNNLSIAAEFASQFLRFANDLIVFCTTDTDTFLKISFIFGSYSLSSMHYADSLREAVTLAQVYSVPTINSCSSPLKRIIRPAF